MLEKCVSATYTLYLKNKQVKFTYEAVYAFASGHITVSVYVFVYITNWIPL